MVWYRFPDEHHNKDGGYVDYLGEPERYSHFDPGLFSHLRSVVSNHRTVASLLPALGETISFDECVDFREIPRCRRRVWRNDWFSRARDRISDCDLVFADPDNGIVDDADRRKGCAKFGKQIPLGEVRALSEGRSAIIYHHNTRRRGGHDAEVDDWLRQFDVPGIAVRAPARSPRTFFALNPDPEIRERVCVFCDRWKTLPVRLHRSVL